MDIRLVSSGSVRNQYGAKASILGVGRSLRGVSVISGTAAIGVDSLPTVPSWANGRKIVAIGIRRQANYLSLSDTANTVVVSGTHTAGSTITGPKSVDLYAAEGDGLRVISYAITASSPYASEVCAFTNPLLTSTTVDPGGSSALPSDAVGYGWWYGNHNARVDFYKDTEQTISIKPTDLQSQFGGTVYSGAPSNVTLYDNWQGLNPTLRGFRPWLDTGTAVTSTRRYFRILVKPLRSISYTITLGNLAGQLDTETNETVCTITSEDSNFLNSQSGFVDLYGNDVLTMGFTPSNMPALVTGDKLFEAATAASGVALNYCFVIK